MRQVCRERITAARSAAQLRKLQRLKAQEPNLHLSGNQSFIPMAAEHTALQESILLLPKRGAVQAGDDNEATADTPPETLEEAKRIFNAAYSAMGIALPRDLLPSDSESDDDEVGEDDGVTETDAVAQSGTDGTQMTPTDHGSSTSVAETPTPPAPVPNADSISMALSKDNGASSVEKVLHANEAHPPSSKPAAASCEVASVAEAGLTKGQRKRRNKKKKAAAAGNGAEAKADTLTQGQVVPDMAARAPGAATTAHAPVKTSKPMTFAERWAAARAAKTAFEAAASETPKKNTEVDDASRPSAHFTDTGESGLILPVEAGYIDTQEDDEHAVMEADASLEDDGPTAKRAHITAADVDNYLRPKLEPPAPGPNRKAELSAPKDMGDSTNIEKFKERYYGLKFGRSSEDAEFVNDVCHNYVKGEGLKSGGLKNLE
jgi:hypothetical protein